MRRRRRLPLAAVVLLLLVAAVTTYTRTSPPAPPPARTATATTTPVARVIDGDTIVIAGGERVRYIGIGTPELRPDGGGGAEPYAIAAKDANAALVAGREVRLVYDDEKRDRYGRLLAYVYVGDTFVNLRLVERGLATARAYPPNTDQQRVFEAAQARARAARVGMWKEQ